MGRVDASQRERYVKRQLDHARQCVDRGDAAQAVDVLTPLIAQHPDEADLWLELSYASRLNGDDAVRYARKANELAPTDSRTYGELAVALSQDPQRLNEAIEVIEQGLALDDGEALNWAVLGTLRLAAGEPVVASLACERALDIDPACVEAHFVLGDAAVAFGALDDAAERYRYVLEVAPHLAAAADAMEWVERKRASTQTPASYTPAAGDASERPHDPADGAGTNRGRAPDGDYGPSMAGPDLQGFDPAAHPEAPVANGSGSAASSDGARAATLPNGADSTIASHAVLNSVAHGSGDDVTASAGADANEVRAAPSTRGTNVLDAVRRHIDAYNQRNLPELIDGFAEDAVLRTGAERIVGREDLWQLFEETFGAAERTELSLRASVVQGDTAACELTERLYEDGEIYESEFIGVYTVLGARILRARLYQDGG